MRDCLLLVDVFNDFAHEDAGSLFDSFRSRFHDLRTLVEHARERDIPLIYANDSAGVFDGEARTIINRAVAGPAGEYAAQIVPMGVDRFVIKPRYSAFDSTPLELILEELRIERILLAGMSTEGCVAQTAIAARERGYKVTVVKSACATVDPEVEEIALAYLLRVVGAHVTVRLTDSAMAGQADSVVRR